MTCTTTTASSKSPRRTMSSLLFILGCCLLSLTSAQTPSDPPVEAAPTLAPDTGTPGGTDAPTIEGWQGCNDPSLGFRPVTIGQPTTVCLILSSSPDWSTPVTYMRLNFQPIADDYSRFHVPTSYEHLVVQQDNALSNIFGSNITVHVASQKALSFQKRYFDGFSKVYPYLTAIINVEEGIVTGITWDNACLFCTANECEPNTFDFEGRLATQQEALQPVNGCFVESGECEELAGKGEAGCDLLLYVVWTGTDSQGKDFRSSAYRFSAFPAQSWLDRLSQNLPSFVPQSTEDLQELNPISNGR